ncbi:hypothetical protein MWU76_19795 [Gelidibacter sp. F2691]|nr:hypothetical protein [Gelidibacter sp. F2691]
MGAPQNAIGLTYRASPNIGRDLWIGNSRRIDQVNRFQNFSLKIDAHEMRTLDANIANLIQLDRFASAVQHLHI